MTENELQAKVVWWARKQWPTVPIFAIPNGGHRSKTQGAILKATGVLAGIPDLMVADGRPGLFIELKTQSGALSEKQKEQIKKLELNGYPVAVAYGIDDAMEKITEYMNR